MFSAILTAFLVVSIVLLQPDNSQLTVQLLALIALQNGAPADSESFLSATAEALPTTVAFRAPINTLIVNALWSISLVLSLAAALFGILAKQWCREYLRWHNTILPARDNVLLRQLRFGAWDTWRVASIIAAIPAFLEIALVLFLVGFLVFVRTFQEYVLTILVSMVIGGTFIGVAFLTFLPVVYRLCPFQSPTGWAFVTLTAFLRTAPWKLVEGLCIVLRWSFQLIGCDRPAWWDILWYSSTDRLLHTRRATDWRAWDIYSVEHPELCKPTVPGIDAACTAMGLHANQASIDTVKTRALIAALSWVRRGSNDDNARTAIRECLNSIHVTRARTETMQQNPHFLSSVHAMCSTDLSQVCDMLRSVLYDVSEGSLSFRAGSRSPFRLSHFNGPFIVAANLAAVQQAYPAACHAWESDAVRLDICHALVRSDVLSLVDDWLSVLNEEMIRKAVAEKLVMLLCMLRMVPSWAVLTAVLDAGTSLTGPWVDTVQTIYRKLAPHRAAYADGLVSICIELCCLLGPVVLAGGGGEYDITGAFSATISNVLGR